MSSVLSIDTECSLCGAIFPQELVAGSATTGLPDLDTRPDEPARSSLSYRVQRCPNCGYCATDISLEYPGAARIVRLENYQKVLRRRSLPEKARQFLAWALIQEANGEFGGAGWSTLHAAWICDDEQKAARAVECRRLALERFSHQRALSGHLPGFGDAGIAELVLADLCRRTGLFQDALRWARAGLDLLPGDVIRLTLETEIRLAEAQDIACHSLEDVK